MIDQRSYNSELSIIADQGKRFSISSTLKRYSGLSVFQRYCIPNSTATRNPLFSQIKRIGRIPFYSLEGASNVSLESRLKKRLLGCYMLGSWHFIALLSNVYFLAHGKDTTSKATHAFFLVMNTYLVANQIEIRSRIKRVMQQRNVACT